MTQPVTLGKRSTLLVLVVTLGMPMLLVFVVPGRLLLGKFERSLLRPTRGLPDVEILTADPVAGEASIEPVLYHFPNLTRVELVDPSSADVTVHEEAVGPKSMPVKWVEFEFPDSRVVASDVKSGNGQLDFNGEQLEGSIFRLGKEGVFIVDPGGHENALQLFARLRFEDEATGD